jgi:hypothetical protein
MQQRAPSGYRFLRAVLIIGAVGFGALGVFYLANGQIVPGVFALFLAIAEALALPLFRKLLESSRQREAGTGDTDNQPPDRTKT